MNRVTSGVVGASLLVFAAIPCAAQRPPSPRAKLQLRYDTTEAAQALYLIEGKRDGYQPVVDDWKPLFATEGYKRLKLREDDMGRAFTDSNFIGFILSDSLGKRAAALRKTLDAWARLDVRSAAAKAFSYLPADAHLAATVYIMIKPRTNSFVYDLDRDPAIFIYLDPAESAAKLENTVAHELHHIGFSTLGAHTDSATRTLPENARNAAGWVQAFGEGFAMLAAAGGPEIHPHAKSPARERAVWDASMKHFNGDLKLVETFFMKVLNNQFATPDDISKAAGEFYGVQGPWYTVGWKMAQTIERKYGRAEVIFCMMDPYRLLSKYNAAAADYNKTHPTAKLAVWSPDLVKAFKRPGA